MLIDSRNFQLTWWKKILLNLLITFAYILVGNVGLLFSTYNGSASPLWPPSGLALAMMLVFGLPQVVPGIVVGVLILAMQSAAPMVSILGLISANLVECIIATLLLRSIGKGLFKFQSPVDVLTFLLVAVFLAPFISSTIAITAMFIGQMVNVSNIPQLWTTFYIGNGLGILLFTPLIVSFFSKTDRRFMTPEALVLAGIVIAMSYWSFEGDSIRIFMMIPILTWVALRFSFRGSALATTVMGMIAVWRSTYLWGVFDSSSPEADLFWIQCLTGLSAIVGYFMATVMEAQVVANEKEVELAMNKKHKRIAEESLAILGQTIHLSPICFGLIDKDYKYLQTNEAMAKLHGMEASLHLGRTLNEITPSTSHLLEPLIDRVFATGESLMNQPYTGLSVGLLSCYPIRHPVTEEIFSVAISFQDMSQELKTQVLLKENQDRLAFAQDAGKIGAFEWESKTNKVLWTKELENIYGLDDGEFNGDYLSWSQMIHPGDASNVADAVTRVLAGEKELSAEFRIITKKNETRWVLARGKMVRDRDGKNLKFIGINIDLTDQKSIEQKLRLTEANLLHALSVRDEFMAIASHELKTPLTSLKLQIQFFQRGIEKQDPLIYTPGKIQNLLEKNSLQIDRLTRLVDDMLDISRIRTGKLTIKKSPCELSSMLMDIIIRSHAQFENCGSGKPVIENLEEAFGEWDALRIEQVMTNIITNAIRYGQGKPISISIQNHQESIRLCVRDQGLGIPKSDQLKIFERYERGLLAREVSGLGLGLFITKQIVEAHQGRIWVESEINQGSAFYVDLPRSTIPLILPNEGDIVDHDIISTSSPVLV